MVLTMCTPVMAADTQANYRDGKTLIVAGSDFQLSSGIGNETNRKNIIEHIMDRMVDYGLTQPDQYLFAGDYDLSFVQAPVTNHGINLVKESFRKYSPNIDEEHMSFISGNHEQDFDGGINIDETGPTMYDDYCVYLINEDDYASGYDEWSHQGADGYKARVTKTANDLKDFLNERIKAGDSRPIFVVSHVPLHITNRVVSGDGKCGSYLFNVLNQGGAAGLTIVYLYGHVHNGGGEDYLGGASVCLMKGDKTAIVKAPTSGYSNDWEMRTLNFTEMNAGYTGYFNSSNGADAALTMTSFLLDETSMQVARYDNEGIHQLKAAGVAGATSYPSDYVATQVYSSPQTINYLVVDKSKLIKDIYTDNVDGQWQEDLGYDVMSVSLDKTELNLRTDTEVQLTATVKPGTALNKNVVWSSSNPTVASVDQLGKVKSLAQGEATITITTEDGGFTAECQVTVRNVALTGLALDKSQLTTYVGKHEQLQVQYTPENTTYPEVTWDSSNPDVIEVDDDGNLNAKSLGSATIIVKSVYDDSISAQCAVTVDATSVEKVVLDKNQLALLIGDTAKLSASVVPADATNAGIIWESSNENVVTVDQEGNVAVVGTGDAIITAISEEGTVCDTCQVKVLENAATVTSIDLGVDTLIVGAGTTYKFDVDFQPWYAADKTVTWTMYNSWAGHVDADGVLHGENQGDSQTVYAKCGSAKAQCSVEIASNNNSNAQWYVADGVLNVIGGNINFTNPEDAPWVKNTNAKNSITSIVIGEGVTTIGNNAFTGLNGVTEISIPATVTSISDSALPSDVVVKWDGHEGETDPDNPDVPVHQHTIVVDKAVPATCTKAGKTEGKHCSVCGEVLVAQEEVAATGHKEVADKAVPATCTKAGKTEGKHCSVCGEVLVAQEVVEAKGHGATEIRNVSEATYEADGYTGDSYCTVCGDIITKGRVIPMLVDETVADKPSISESEDKIFKMTNDGDVPGSKFYKLRARVIKNTKTTQTLKWTRVSKATGYIIYGNRCGKTQKYKKLKTIKSGDTIKWKRSKLKKGRSYKYMVVAVRNGKVIAKSKTIHVRTTGGKYTNFTKVSVNKTKVMLKKGGKFKIKAKGLKKSTKKVRVHKAIKYESTNKKVATVTSKGTIKAVGKGTCRIYVYVQNGLYKSIKVTVK